MILRVDSINFDENKIASLGLGAPLLRPSRDLGCTSRGFANINTKMDNTLTVTVAMMLHSEYKIIIMASRWALGRTRIAIMKGACRACNSSSDYVIGR